MALVETMVLFGTPSLFLLDGVLDELGDASRDMFIDALRASEHQVFMTARDCHLDELKTLLGKKARFISLEGLAQNHAELA